MCVYTGVCSCVCSCVYLAACYRVQTPVTCLTPVTGVSLGVGGADALTSVVVAVSTSVITAASWEENRAAANQRPESPPIGSQTGGLLALSTCAAVGVEPKETVAASVTLVSSHALDTLAPPVVFT